MSEDTEPSPAPPQAQPQVATAGFLRRFLAAVIDGLIPAAIVSAAFLPFLNPWAEVRNVTRSFAEPPLVMAQIGAFLVLSIAYGIFMLGRFGWTLGMRAVKVRVVSSDGSPIGYTTAAVRGLAYWLPLVLTSIPQQSGGVELAMTVVFGAWGIGVLWMIVDRNRQGFHDKFAGTRVVRTSAARAGSPPGRVAWAVFLVLSLIVLFPFLLGLDAYRVQGRVKATLAQLKAQGRPFTEANPVGPPIPDAENAAPLYDEALPKVRIPLNDETWLVSRALSNWAGGAPLGHGMTLATLTNPSRSTLSEPSGPSASASKQVFEPADRLPTSVPSNPGEPSDAQVLAALQQRLAGNSEGLGLLYKAAAMEKCRFNDASSTLPSGFGTHLIQMKAAARDLNYQAAALGASGDVDGALREATASLNICNQFRGMPSLMSMLTGCSVLAIGLATVERVLYDSDPSPALCLEVEARLAQVDFRAAFSEGIAGDAADTLGYIQGLEHTRSRLPATQDKARATQASAGLPAIVHAPMRRWLAGENLSYIAVASAETQEARVPLYEERSRPSPSWQQIESPMKSRWPLPPRDFARDAVDLFHKMNSRVAEAEAKIGLARIALLLKVYREERGAYPGSLDELARFAGKELPVDPFSRGPFHYQLKDSGFILYGVGRNSIDDGGKVRVWPGFERPIPSLNSSLGGDLVWVCRQ